MDKMVKGLIVVDDSGYKDIWVTCLKQIIGDVSHIDHVQPQYLTHDQHLLDILQRGYQFIILPLTLPHYNSLRLAEHAHRLQISAKIILLSGTDADEGALRALFDSYIPTEDFAVGTVKSALANEAQRDKSIPLVSQAIARILDTASCFSYRHWHGRIFRPTMEDYVDGRITVHLPKLRIRKALGGKREQHAEAKSEPNFVYDKESEMLAEIMGALKIIKEAPEAVEALQKVGLSLGLLERIEQEEIATAPPMEQAFDEDTALGKVIKSHVVSLDKLVKRYGQIDSQMVNEIDKEEYRERIAAAACRLLTASEPIKEHFPNYDTLVALFCKYQSIFEKDS